MPRIFLFRPLLLTFYSIDLNISISQQIILANPLFLVLKAIIQDKLSDTAGSHIKSKAGKGNHEQRSKHAWNIHLETSLQNFVS